MSLVSVALYSVAFLAFLVVFALAVSQDSETTWLDHVDKIAGFGSFLLAVIALSVSLGVRRSATSMGEAEFLKKATTRLVRESRKHWDDEIRGQGLSAPSPLEVWGKVVDRASARTTVVQRFGEAILHVWGARPGKNGAAAEDVATELLDALWRQVGVRRLVVLGAAGSGKTLVAISFIARLLKERRTGDPVPILVPIGAWNPGQPVWDLLIQHLNEQFPWLADPQPVRRGRGQSAARQQCGLSGL